VDEQIVILHGIIKKSQKTPQQALELARQRQSQCENIQRNNQ
jgi:phage-related protein